MSDDDLVKRLRDWQEHDEGKINDARQEAAARIEALTAERDRLREALQFYDDLGNNGRPGVKAREALKGETP